MTRTDGKNRHSLLCSQRGATSGGHRSRRLDMPEDRFGVSGRMTERRKRLATRLNRRNRRLVAAGLPLMAIAAAALPTAISHVTAENAAALRPSYTLCTGWLRCTGIGYPSYHYQTR